jgi:hypothetical protein
MFLLRNDQSNVNVAWFGTRGGAHGSAVEPLSGIGNRAHALERTTAPVRGTAITTF